MSPFEKVKEFHKAFGQPVGESPQFLTDDRIALRRTLIEEEYEEFLQAIYDGDLVNAAKEVTDLLYVVYGTAVEMGIDIDSVFDEVHSSNMSKLDENGKAIFRDDGKVLKSDRYRPADVASVM